MPRAIGWRGRWWAGLAAIAALPVAAADVRLHGLHQELLIATQGGLPTYWLSCDAPCTGAVARRRVLVGPGEGALRWSAAGGDEGRLAGLRYRAELIETPESVTAVLTASEPLDGRVLVQRYVMSKTSHELSVRLRSLPGAGLRLATGPAFVPPQLPGFGASFSDVEAVRVAADGQDEPGEAAGEPVELTASRNEWLGIRSRFWAWLARSDADVAALIEATGWNERAIEWRAAAGELDLVFFAGPIEWKSLRVVAPELTQMLFAALWEPLRWLCFGLLFLLGFISRWVTNAGLAIILLSLAVKFILYPLTRIADRWQQEVNRIQSRIQPRLAAIRREFRGEEAHRRTLALYREEGVHPMFTLRSLAGFAIQVPMFIAAFDMLADNYALAGERFLWIENLAAPDRFAPLPFALPFFGAHVNLLPVIMTAFTVLSALTQRDGSLSPELLRKQQRQLYLMAAGFFLLFYTFPAGMVLYWTANNFWHFLKMQLTHWLRRGR